MMRSMIFVAIATAVACGSSKSDSVAGKGAMQTFSLTTTGSDTPVKVQASIPSSWTVDTSSDGPAFKISGADVKQLTFTAISLGGDEAARVAKAIKMQYDDAAGAERAELSGGRVWMSAPQGNNIHARIFVPSPDGVVMGFALVASASADRLPEVRRAFETLAVVP